MMEAMKPRYKDMEALYEETQRKLELDSSLLYLNLKTIWFYLSFTRYTEWAHPFCFIDENRTRSLAISSVLVSLLEGIRVNL
jgi:hypothetical protein